MLGLVKFVLLQWKRNPMLRFDKRSYMMLSAVWQTIFILANALVIVRYSIVVSLGMNIPWNENSNTHVKLIMQAIKDY